MHGSVQWDAQWSFDSNGGLLVRRCMVRTMPSELVRGICTRFFALAASSYHRLTGYCFWSHAGHGCARVIRACAVGIARRGAQTGRLGAPCKTGWALVLTQHCGYEASDMNPPSLGARRPFSELLAALHCEGQRSGESGSRGGSCEARGRPHCG